jgi:hypothetical protein
VNEPWSRGHLVRLAVIVGLGGLVCGLAWNATATRSRLDDQTGFVALGVAGLLVAAAAQVIWLRSGRRAVAAHSLRTQASVAALLRDAIAVPAPPGVSASLVAAEGMRHFHRPECPIATGRPWPPESRRTHEAAGRTPCGICRP